MNTNKKESKGFEFRKAMKKDALFPFLKYVPVANYIYRPIASLVVRALFNTAITPTQVTYISFFLGILSGIFFCFGEPLYFIIAAILLQVSLVFDCADGMLARSKDMCTRFGGYLDLFLDRIVDFFVFTGIAIGHFVYSGNLKLFIAGVFATALAFLEISLDYITRNYDQRKKTGEGGAVKHIIVFFTSILSFVNRLDIFIFTLLITTIIIISVRVLTFPLLGRKK